MPFDDSLLTYPDGTEAPQVTEDGMELEEPSKETTEDPAVLAEPAEPQLPSEFEKLFKGCEENPEDFNGWVYLLQYVEQEVRPRRLGSDVFIYIFLELNIYGVKFIFGHSHIVKIEVKPIVILNGKW